MDLHVKLFVQQHESGFYTVSLVGEPDLSVYTDQLERAREELSLVIGDRVERSHPRLQSSFAAAYDYRHETVSIDEGLPVFRDGEVTREPLEVSMLVAERRPWRSLWFIRLDLHYFVPLVSGSSSYEDAAKRLLNEHFRTLTDNQAFALKSATKEWIETLDITASPPPLSAFTGKNKGLTQLPLEAELRAKKLEAAEREKEVKQEKGRRDRATPTFKRIGVELTERAKADALDGAFERDADVDALFALLSAATSTAVVLVGPPGVGKTAILDALVQRIASPDAPRRVVGRKVWFADASRLVAGEGWFGDWQRQLLDAVQECEEVELIWFIGDVLPLLDAGKHVGSDQNVAQLLKPFLQGRRITVVAESTPSDWAKVQLRDSGFARAFTPYRVEEVSDESAQVILRKVSERLERIDGVKLDQPALAAIRQLCRRYASDESALGTAIHFLRRIVERAAAADLSTVGRTDVVRQFCSETGLPEVIVRDDSPLDPGAVQRAFSQRLIGQELAVSKMADLIHVIKAGLSDLSKPLGSFLFVGPTGVGKTETAKALAQWLFGSTDRLTRFDMSEYVGWDAIHRFLGTAEEEGKLVAAIRRRPFSVVLLDEIEKANPDIFDVLLQVLGEARLTDESGRTADFRNAVVIMTSNLGVESFSRPMGFDSKDDDNRSRYERHFIAAAEGFFRPELFNRIDHIVPFQPLGAEAIDVIAHRELDKLSRREGFRQRKLTLALAPEIAPWLAEHGVDPRYGARPLKRELERRLTIPIARFLGGKKDERMRLDVRPEGDGVVIEGSMGKAAAGSERARESLKKLLDRADRLRFVLDRWMASRDYRELERSLSLLEKLASNPRFWAAKEEAERRTRNMKPMQELRARFEDVRGHLSSAEDLAFEAYFDRNDSVESQIASELDEVETKGRALEIDLFSRRFQHGDNGLLYFVPSAGSRAFCVEVLAVYLEIAFRMGWKVHAFEAKPEIAGEPPDAMMSPNKWRASIGVWHWRKLDVPDDSAWIADGRFSDAARNLIRITFATLSQLSVVALAFEGRGTAALFSGEHGTHQLIRGSDVWSVGVVFEDRGLPIAGQLTHPHSLVKQPRTLRTVHEGKRTVRDHVLGYHVAMEARLSRTYRRFMQSRLFFEVFGPEGVHWVRKRKVD